MNELTKSPLRVLFVGHEASRTGAPMGLLSLMRWWLGTSRVEPLTWLRRGGPLVESHRPLGSLAVGGEAGELAVKLNQGVNLAYLNTATLGGFAEALRDAGVPVICHAHEMDYELGLTGKANLERLRRSVRLFVACSESVRESLKRRAGIEDGRILVVPECVDVERATRLAKEPPALDVTGLGKRVVCGMGTVGWRKGTDLFLRVVAELGEDWTGLWIGDLDASPDAVRLRHDLRILKLEDRVVFTGALANPFAVLRQADVFCLTSREDPYPLAMVEAAALGLPVIGFRGSGGVEEFAEAGGAELAGYADARDMAERVREATRKIGGENLARRLCAPEVVGARLLEIIEQSALPAVTGLPEGGIAALARAASEPLRVMVECAPAESGEAGSQSWEGAAGETAEVELKPELKSGQLEVTLQPCLRSMILSKVELVNFTDGGERRLIKAKTRSAGRAVRIGKGEGGTWLLLDGQGRLILRTQEEVRGRILLRWETSASIKAELERLLDRPEGQHSMLGWLGLKKSKE